jgi:hypothetical protein
VNKKQKIFLYTIISLFAVIGIVLYSIQLNSFILGFITFILVVSIAAILAAIGST